MQKCKICQTITKKSISPPSKYNLCTIHKRLLLWGVGRIVDPENLNTRLPSYHISLTAGMKTICTCIFANCAHVYQNALLTLHRVPYAKIRHVTCRTFNLHDFIIKRSQNKKGRIFFSCTKNGVFSQLPAVKNTPILVQLENFSALLILWRLYMDWRRL